MIVASLARTAKHRSLPTPQTQKPTITPALCDNLYQFLRSGNVLTVHVVHGQVTMEMWRDLVDDLYYTRYTFDLTAMFPDDQPEIVEPAPSPILLDTIEEIAERSPQLLQRLHASFSLAVHGSAC